MSQLNRDTNGSSSSTKEITIPKYMQNFSCIGPDCEDTCCKLWHIHIDKANFKKLRKTMSSTQENRELFRTSIKKNKSANKSDLNYASIKLRKDNQYCPLFTEEQLCHIHKNYGEAYLSRTCRTYPRRPIFAKDRWEISGSLSCPEIARACLLQENSTQSTTKQETSKVLDTLAKELICDDLNDPYVFYLHEMRSIFDQLLVLEGYPYDSKLFFVAFLTNRITPFFRKTVQFSEEQLAEQIQEVTDEATIQKLHEGYQGLEANINLPLNIINSLLQAKMDSHYVQSLLNMMEKTYTGMSTKSTTNSILDQAMSHNDINTIYQQYQKRYKKVVQTFGDRLELILLNFARNQIFSFPYIQNESIYTATQTLTLKFGMVNFFIVCHHDLTPYLESLKTNDELQENALAIFDKVAVDVIYSFSRALEHDRGLWGNLNKTMEESNIEGLALLTQFIQFSFAR